MKLIIAGYTAAPTQPQAAAEYYGELMQLKQADGLEFAWSGPQTPDLLEPVLSRLPAAWSITLNDIPATWRACTDNPKFGLASPDAAGRESAVRMVGDMRAGIKRINERAGRQVVAALEIHSAPGFDNRVLMPDARAFKQSLEEIAALDWAGCSVMVEHCDAFIDGQKPAKGFLRLDDEIRTLGSLAGSPVTLSLNWGRSMIELRDADRVLDHVIAASRSGLLRGYTFSGTAGTDNEYGVAWLDSHLPFANTVNADYQESASGMTTARAAQVLPYLGDCEFVAIKTNWPSKRTDPLERAASVAANFDTLVALLRSSPALAARMHLEA
jgi:hypothetical protein